MSDIENEIWKQIPGFEKYEASNWGRVRSKYKILKPQKYPNGYLKVTLGRGSQNSVHFAVARAFLGLRPEGFHICHNDGDKTNNRIENLRYDTVSKNSLDKIQHGTMVYGGRKLKASDADFIRSSLKNCAELALEFKVDQSHIFRIKKGERWKR